MKLLNHLNLAGNEIQNARLQALAADPTFKVALVFFRTSDQMVVVGRGSAFEYLIPSGEKGTASGIASLNSSSKVVQDPANAQATSAPNKIPMAGAGGKLDVAWLPLGTGNGIDADKLDSQEGAYYLDRNNHTGTQLAATISDFMATVFGARLDQLTAPTTSVNLNGQRLMNVPTVPTATTDAVNAAYVDQKLQGLGQKHSAKAATTANITLSGAQTIDGISLVAGDLCLVWKQTTPAQNGLYTVSASSWTRAVDADVWSELISAYCFVEQGATYGDCGFVCTADTGGTLGTTAINWVQFSRAGVFSAANVGVTGQATFKQQNGNIFEFRSVAGNSTKVAVTLDAVNNAINIDIVEANLSHANIGGITPITAGGTGSNTAAGARANLVVPTKFSQDIGDGATLNIVVTHNLGTLDHICEVYDKSTNEKVYPNIIHGTNADTFQFATAPTTAQYRVVLVG